LEAVTEFACHSENNLINLLNIENNDIKYFKNKEEIKKTILKARKNSSAKGFMLQE
jgi:hypothetical protein